MHHFMITDKIYTKKFILSLIKDDLINTKLILGLRDINLNADDYTLHLSETIFSLMGIENSTENDAVFDRYFDLAKRTKFIHLHYDTNLIDELALDIYNYLDLVRLK